jgi:hypothetical protein
MKVKQLIEELQLLDENKEVRVYIDLNKVQDDGVYPSDIDEEVTEVENYSMELVYLKTVFD